MANSFTPESMAFAGYAISVQLMLLLRSKGILTAAEIDAIMLDTVQNMRDAGSPHAEEVAQIIASTFEAASPSQH